MKGFRFRVFVLMLLVISGCEKAETTSMLVSKKEADFSGGFKSIGSDILSGTVTLTIFNSHYECFTNLPYGHGAGRLEMDKTTMNFIDTLFFPIPAMYGPTFVLSGEYNYRYDGKALCIWKELTVGEIMYELKPIK